MMHKFQSTGPSGGQTSRFKVRGREVEHRRLRGEASCAECRRCKLKCDKKIPCSSCVRRGCQTLCPNGSMSGGTGSRVIFSSTDTMHKKLLEMSQRIRQLEDVVQILQGMQSNKPHPLLDEKHLQIKTFKNNEEDDNETNDDGGEQEDVAGLTDALGTLAIADNGEVRFMGRVSNEAVLLSGALKSPEPITICNEPELLNLHTSDSFSFVPGEVEEGLSRADVLRSIEARLPSYQRACIYVEAYLTHVAWFSRLITREQIVEEIIPIIYKRGAPGASSASGRLQGRDCNDVIYVHRLALFFAIMACSAAVEMSLPANSAEAARYYALARTSVSLRSVFQGTSLESVQTAVLLAHYQFYSCQTCTFEPAWKMLIFAMTLGLSIGLHRDPSRWDMDPKLRERRRTVFWELFSSDKWKSLESGRPSIFNLAESDCEFPADAEGSVGSDGTFRPSYWRWKQMFAKEVTGPVAEFMALAKPVKYSEVIELDRKVREFNLKPIPVELLGTVADMGAVIRRSTIGVYREIALLSLHRNFFARAMLDDSEKAFSGPYSASVLAAYACSISLLKHMRTQYVLQSPMLNRQWFLWIHSLIASVIIGTIAIKGPSPIALRAAQSELESAIELFGNASVHPICRGGLVILRRLLDKSRYRNQFAISPDASGLTSGNPTQGLYGNDGRSVDADEELRLLGGGARTINIRSAPSSSASTGVKDRTTHASDQARTTFTPSAQSTSNMEGLKRSGCSSELFAVDSDARSVFCSPQQDNNATASPSARSGNNHDVDIQGPLNFIANNLGIGTGGDAMATPPMLPSEDELHQPGAAAGRSRYHPNLEGAELPTVPPPSDPLTLISSFYDTSIPHSAQAYFGAGPSGTGFVGSAMDMDAGMDLGSFETSNMNFDFLMDNMLSSGSVSSTSSQNESQGQSQVQNGQSNGQNNGYPNDAVGAAAWHALLGEMQALRKDVSPDSSAFEDLARLR